MKSLTLLLVAAIITLSLPSCASAKKKDESCCGDKSCSASAGHMHGKKKGS